MSINCSLEHWLSVSYCTTTIWAVSFLVDPPVASSTSNLGLGQTLRGAPGSLVFCKDALSKYEHFQKERLGSPCSHSPMVDAPRGRFFAPLSVRRNLGNLALGMPSALGHLGRRGSHGEVSIPYTGMVT